jgi:transposase
MAAAPLPEKPMITQRVFFYIDHYLRLAPCSPVLNPIRFVTQL